MKTFFSSTSLRGLAQTGALFLAFGLGLYCGTQGSPPVATSKGSKPTGGYQPSAMLATAPASYSPAPAAVPTVLDAPGKSAITPTSRLGVLIKAAATLSEPQTIAYLRHLYLRPDGFETKLQRHVLLSRFAELDPQTALTYVDTLSGGERDEQTASVYANWASRDPQAAAARFQSSALTGSLACTEDRDTAAAIAGEWSHRDPNSALSWAASLPEEIRAEARTRVLSSLTMDNPALAVHTAASLPAGYERSEAMQPVAAQWAQTAPDRAAAWVQSLSNPNDQASTDPMLASQWVSSLPKGQTRDAAITGLVRAQSLLNDPEAATLWADSVQNRDLRQQLVAETSKRLQLQDPSAASAWRHSSQN